MQPIKSADKWFWLVPLLLAAAGLIAVWLWGDSGYTTSFAYDEF